jgi:hypothetical protein
MLQGKVEASIPVKISSCSYLETRFPPTKNKQKVKLERSIKLIFFEIFLYKIEYFL